MHMPSIHTPFARPEYPACLPASSPTLSTRSLPNTCAFEIEGVRNVALNVNATLPRFSEHRRVGLSRTCDHDVASEATETQRARRALSISNDQPARLAQRELSSRDALTQVLSVHPSHSNVSDRRRISLPAVPVAATEWNRSPLHSPFELQARTSGHLTSAPASLEKKLTGSASTIDWSPSISTAQQTQAAGCAFIRDGLSALIGGAAKYGAMQLLANSPASWPLTLAGAVAGGLSGAYAGAGLSQAIIPERYADNHWVVGAANGLSMICGGTIGALGSLCGYSVTSVNQVAVEQLSSLVGAYSRDVNQQWLLKEMGPRVERAPTWRSATASFLIYAAELSGIHGLASYLLTDWNPQLKNLVASALVEASDGAAGTLVRSRLTDATFKRGLNTYSFPTTKASLCAKTVELSNASLLRNVGTSLTNGVKYAMANIGLPDPGNPHALAAIHALASAPTAFRALLSTHVLPNNQKILGYAERLSADPGTIPVNIEGIVAGLDSVAVVSTATPQRISTLA